MELMLSVFENQIKYQKPSYLSELYRFLRIMSINDPNDNSNHSLSSFQREFESLRIKNRQLLMIIQQIVSLMNSQKENQLLLYKN